jgi:predicted RNase H-like nuclease (RuvC/YqgF family)
MQLKIFLVTIFILTLVGCATTKEQAADTELYQLQTQVKQLRWQLQEKDEKISDLENQLEKTRVQTERTKEVKIYSSDIQPEKGYIVKPTAEEIQTALKNAGFYNGSIDGKIGKKTKSAIREFQKANELVVDGVVGDKTWAKLGKYLY